MEGIASYFITGNGRVYVGSTSGEIREATVEDWSELWTGQRKSAAWPPPSKDTGRSPEPRHGVLALVE